MQEAAKFFDILCKAKAGTCVSLPCGGSAIQTREKVEKGVQRMPRLSEAKKDAISCDKLRGVAHEP